MTETRPNRLLVLLGAVALLLALVPPLGASAQTTGFPSVGTDFADDGPYDTDRYRTSSHTFYHPSDLGEAGVRHPVILWGNGTGASPTTYASFLRHLASHGFIVAAANTAYAGTGTAMLAGLDELERLDGSTLSRFGGHVDLDNVAATGHSQGGGGAIETAPDPRVDTIFPLQPWRGTASAVDVPAIYFSGGSDRIVSARSVERAFGNSSGPALYAELRGAGHFVPTGSAGDYRGPATAWARWFLMGDEDAEQVFLGDGCELCGGGWLPTWSDYQQNSDWDAAPGPN